MKLTNEYLKQLVMEALEQESALVSVKAGSKTKTGQAKPAFKEKDNNPKVYVSEPFVEKVKEDAVEKLDKEHDKKTKTFVSGGTKAPKKDQPKPEVKEKAPEPEKVKRIAKAEFELKESYTKKDLAKLIYEEAKKIVSNVNEDLRKGVYNDFNKWKESFPEDSTFKTLNNYMVAFDKSNKELGKWNPSSKMGMHIDDFQYKSL